MTVPPPTASTPLQIVVDLTSQVFRGLDQTPATILEHASSCAPAELVVVNQREASAAMSTPASPDDTEAGSLDIVEEWGLQSFPASDPPANW